MANVRNQESPSTQSRRRVDRVFVVRIWRETGAQAADVRCSVDDVGAGRRRVFSGFSELTDYLRGCLDGAPKIV